MAVLTFNLSMAGSLRSKEAEASAMVDHQGLVKGAVLA